MENLCFILEKIQAATAELGLILTEELSQLKRPQINPVLLQIVADSKSRLLSTIAYYEDQRKAQESSLKIAAPYQQNADLSALWSLVRTKVKQANALNQEIYGLLDMHLQKANSLKSIVNKVGSNMSLYGSDGHSSNAQSGRVYNITI